MDKVSAKCAVNYVVRLQCQNCGKDAVHGVIGTCSDCGISLGKVMRTKAAKGLCKRFYVVPNRAVSKRL